MKKITISLIVVTPGRRGSCTRRWSLVAVARVTALLITYPDASVDERFGTDETFYDVRPEE